MELTEEEMLEEIDATFRHLPDAVQEEILAKARIKMDHPLYRRHYGIDPDSDEDFTRTVGRVMGMYPLNRDIVRMREVEDVAGTIYKGVLLENTGIRLAILPDGMYERVCAKAEHLVSSPVFRQHHGLGEHNATTYSWTLNYVMDHPKLLHS